MTIQEALISLNSFPIPTNFIEKVGIERSLTVANEYTLAVSTSQSYRLATADVYMWLYGQPSLGEQEVNFNQTQEIKKGFLDIANSIYLEYNDPKYTGKGTYGYKGEDFNG